MKAQNKVRMVIECSLDERALIKMLAANNHMTISEYFLVMARDSMTKKHKAPKEETKIAIKELEEGRGTRCNSLDDFWSHMGIDLNA